jgi:hypothetical protein
VVIAQNAEELLKDTLAVIIKYLDTDERERCICRIQTASTCFIR